MSGESDTPITGQTEPAAQVAEAAPAAAAVEEKAAPAAAAETDEKFLPDTTESKPEAQAEGAEKKDEAKPEGEAKDFLAETDDDKAEKEADAQGDAKKEGESEAYQPFTLPEGMTLDEGMLAEATPIFRKLNLDQEGAQELVSLYATKTKNAVEAYHETLAEGHRNTLKAWETELKGMPEYKSGEALKEAKGRVVKALNALGTPALREILGDSQSGYGLVRNPHVFKFLDAVGSKLSEDSLVSENAGAPEKTAPQRDADVLYS